ncbi:MAG TPA: carbon-nitrogen hydrolase family protein [Trueperaceae bacterium]|nr:carbon-nitrogen hydrolase family protein [Trueperaceae bacterium]
MSKPFGIAGVQLAVAPWDPDATFEKIAAITRRIAQGFPWVGMVVFHELAASGLVQFDRLPSPEEWARVRAPIPGPLTDRLCALAKSEGLWLVPGSLYESDGERLYNTAIVISPDGEITARYRKMFPWYPFEAETTPGSEYCVFDVPDVGRFGLSICYDMWFPETVRTLAWMGAEVILHPTMTPTQDRELELVLSRAHAITNQVYFVDVNGVGPWGGGRSLAVDPEGRVLHEAGEAETFFTVLIEPGRVKRVREMGTLGLVQSWKQLRDAGMRFPPYQEGGERGAVFEGLGPLATPTEVP